MRTYVRAMLILDRRRDNNMSNTADRIRKQLEKKKAPKSSSEELLDTINDASALLVKKFLANVQAGSVELNDVPDLVRVISMAGELNSWSNSGTGGAGAPPAISLRQSDILDQTLSSSKEIIDGEETDVIDLSEVESLSNDDVEKLLREREVGYNQENEATF